jgi:hypothetical protein
MAISWIWVRLAVVVAVLGLLLVVGWLTVPRPSSPSIVNTRDTPAVVATPIRPPDNEDD